ncbi:MAG: hypothetical protein OEY51_11770 [Cyclobacteriaceae bacterium]|nr:hypothetical protein [Cyclobacteriaceae bacterium]
MKKGTLILFVLMLISVVSNGQYSVAGLSMQTDVHEWYDGQIKRKNTSLVTGTYREVKKRIPDSHPFFISDKWIDGNLHYQGQTFNHVSLLYDMEEDELIFRHPETFLFNLQPIKPIQPEITWFTLEGHLFRYIHHSILGYKEGFFEIRYEGLQTSFLTKRIRSVVTDPDYKYANNDVNILQVGSDYYKIKSRLIFYKLFKDSRKQIRLYIKQHQVRFKKENDQNLDGLVQYCDTIIANK